MKKKFVYLFLCMILIVSGCNKDDEMVTNLIITTVDEDGIPFPGVNVELYYSVKDWTSESSPVYETRETDSDGRITFMEIDTGTYYINAFKEAANNWEQGVKKRVIEGFQNITNVTVVESNSGYLSSADGKDWILSEFLTNGEDSYDFLDDCVKDDTLTFYKGPELGAYNLSRGTLKCTTFQEDNIPGLWSLLDNGTVLQIQLGNDIINWNIDSLKVDKLSVTYVEVGNVQNVTYVPAE